MKKNTITILGVILLTIFSVNGQSRYNKMLYKGVNFEIGQQNQEALKSYSDAIELRPNKENAFIYRSKLNFRLKNYDEAMADINKAISINPNNEEALNIRAKLYIKNDNLRDAIEDQKRILSVTKEGSDLYNKTLFNMSECYLALANYNEQNQALNKLVNILKSNSMEVPIDYYEKRGVSSLRINKNKEAISDFEFVEKKYPNDASNLYRIGWAYFKLGDDANSQKYFEKIINVDPTKKIVYTKDNYKKMFEYEKNKALHLEEILNISSKLSTIKDIQSELFVQIEYKSLFESGMDLWYRLVSAYPEDKKIKDDYVVVLKKIYSELKEKPAISEEARKLVVQASNATEEKRYMEALFLFSKSLQVAPCNHLAYYNLALLYERIGFIPSAISQMQEYIKLYPQAPDLRSAKDKIYEWEGKTNPSNAVTTSTDPDLKNEYHVSEADMGFFIMSYGFNNPRGQAKLFNSFETTEQRFFNSKQIGMKNGFCLEIGGGFGGYSNRPKESFMPGLDILVRYRQNQLDWSSAGGMFAEPQNFNKSLRFIEITEKINFSLRVAQNTFAKVYYSPALVIPLNLEFRQKNAFTTNIYDVSNPVRFGQAIGWSLRYKKFSLGYEWDFITFKTTIYYREIDNLTNKYTTNTSTTGKYRITYGNLRLSLYL
jgi:tetratricopeptide (TPR) repeat protein